MVKISLSAVIEELRPLQWSKNVLALVGVVLAHKWSDPAAIRAALTAAAALCLASSMVYVMNDIVDVDRDRVHDRHRLRPFASGRLPIGVGFWLIPALLVGTLLVASQLAIGAVVLIAVYLFFATGYTMWLKRALWIDVVTLSGLYTLRVLAGVVAVSAPISPWLIAFSCFVFMGLAVLKRYADLRFEPSRLAGRPYVESDRFLLLVVGVGCSLLSVLVLALYANSEQVAALYSRPWAIALMCPIVAVWLLRLWTLADRGQLAKDPVLYALQDPVSYASLVACGLVLVVAL